MYNQIDWNDLVNEDSDVRRKIKTLGKAKLKYLSEPHVACCLLVDTSGSMGCAGKIQQLNDALSHFRQEVCADPLSAMRVDVCLIEFNTDVSVRVPFCPIEDFNPPELQAGGSTSMGKGIRFALEAVHEQVHAYHEAGVECYKPFVLMITDGQPTDDIEGIARLIAERENAGNYGHLRFHAFGVKGADMELLQKFTHRVLAIANNAFSDVFNWASKSMQMISHSRPTDNIAGAPISPNMVPLDQPLPWDN